MKYSWKMIPSINFMSGARSTSTRKYSCINARGISPAAQVLTLLLCLLFSPRFGGVLPSRPMGGGGGTPSSPDRVLFWGGGCYPHPVPTGRYSHPVEQGVPLSSPMGGVPYSDLAGYPPFLSSPSINRCL